MSWLLGLLAAIILALGGGAPVTPVEMPAIAPQTATVVESVQIKAPAVETIKEVPIVQKSAVKQPVVEEKPAILKPAVQKTIQPTLSNDNYYKNSAGNTVHSPAYSNDNSIPAGASARCGDGTYSFSQSRRGTCSHHGGVALWL